MLHIPSFRCNRTRMKFNDAKIDTYSRDLLLIVHLPSYPLAQTGSWIVHPFSIANHAHLYGASRDFSPVLL
jgi:hypothetical protein